MKKILTALAALALATPAAAEAQSQTIWLHLHKNHPRQVCTHSFGATDTVYTTAFAGHHLLSFSTVTSRSANIDYFDGYGTLVAVTNVPNTVPLCIRAITWNARSTVRVYLETRPY